MSKNLNKSYDSVWDAIEDDPIKADNYKLRSQLMREIVARLNEVTDSQQQAAELLKTTQPRISALKQGKFSNFRLDILVDYALRLGLGVSIKLAT